MTQKSYESGVYSYFLRGDKIPSRFSIQSKGSSLSFFVPALVAYKIRGLVVCCVYTNWKQTLQRSDLLFPLTTVMENKTKHVECIHVPVSFGVPNPNEDMIWISHWNFGDLFEGGNEVEVSMRTTAAQGTRSA